MKATLPLLLAAVSLAIAFCGKSPDSSNAPAAATAVKEERQSAEAAALLQRVQHFLNAEKHDSALLFARQAIEISEKEQDWKGWGKAYINTLVSLYYSGRSAEAVAAFPSIEKTGDEHLLPKDSFWGQYYNCAAAISEDLGDYEQALSYGQSEFDFYEKINDLNSLAVAANNLGTYYRGRGDFDRALEYTESALRVYLSKPDTNAANLVWTYGNLSKIWYRKKEFSKAIGTAHKALEILERDVKKKKAEDYIIAYNDLANAYIEIQKYDTAISYLQKALLKHQNHPNVGGIEYSWHNMGTALRFMSGKLDEAARYLNLAIDGYGSSHPNLGKAYRHLAYIERKKGNYSGALTLQQQALRALAGPFHDDTNILANPPLQRVDAYSDFLLTLCDKGETLRKLAENESSPKFLEAALATFDMAASVLDSMRTVYQEGSREFWNREARPIMENAIEAAFFLHEKTGERKYLEQAFRYAEKSKALLLAETLRESAAKRQVGISGAILQEEKDLKIAIAFYKSKIIKEEQKTDADADKIARWKNEYLKKTRAYETFLDSLKDSFPEYYKIKYQNPAPTSDAIMEWLPPNGGLLDYFRGDANIYAFYFDKKTFIGYKIAPDTNYTNHLISLLERLRNRNRVYEEGLGSEAIADFAQNAGALYRTLLLPAGKMPEKLVIIPDGDLAYLPFELLLTDAPAQGGATYSQLSYLLLQTTTRYEYSAGLAMQTPPLQKTQTYFEGYAPSYENTRQSPSSTRDDSSQCMEMDLSRLPALSNNQKEVRAIAQMLFGKSYAGATATEEIFKRNASRPRILHLAMHGFLNDCNPLLSGLAFSLESINKTSGDSVSDDLDGLLYAYEIYNLKINADLAVLSACNTGSGQLAKGEGVMSLARAFKYAGCPNVVMSLWQAEDAATAQIMKDFYRQLQQGVGKDHALRQAKLNHLKSNKLDHPYFWSAFVLIGDDKTMPRNIPWALYLTAGLAAAVLVGAGFYFWKHKNKSKPH